MRWRGPTKVHLHVYMLAHEHTHTHRLRVCTDEHHGKMNKKELWALVHDTENKRPDVQLYLILAIFSGPTMLFAGHTQEIGIMVELSKIASHTVATTSQPL